ncbi:MAG: DUF502 domain-containing protein [Xanthomonadaceae bacterium]|nr:DUF502 domain-containing protein [Xanthomonadaceae bacterium]
MKAFSRMLLTGLFTVLPVVVTVAIIMWLVGTLEGMLGGLIAWLLPEGAYQRGMGLVASIALVFAVGAIMSHWLAQRLFEVFERLMMRVPVLKSVYGAIKDITELFSPEKQRQFSSVVTFTLPGTDAKLIGFITRNDCTNLPDGLAGPDLVAVYLPMSYQIGGYTLFLPRDRLEYVDMPTSDALRFTLTAGVTGAPASGATRRPS